MSDYSRVEPNCTDKRTSHLANGTWTLSQEIHDWLIAHGFNDYRFHWMRGLKKWKGISGQYWEVELPNVGARADEAVLFKLKFGI